MREDSALFKHELAVVLIAKNEAPYIREWIDYHLLAGVDHFYIYDNDSEDDLEGMLKPYVDSGVVDYQKFPGKIAQNAVYFDAISKHKFDCRYLALIDADEFIHPIDPNKTIKDVLHEVLDERPQAAGLAINWRLFGSNGLEKAELEKGVLARFTRRATDDFEPNAHIKSIVNPHFTLYFVGKIAVNESGGPVPSYSNIPSTTNSIGLNHYYTKSREEFQTKIERGRGDAHDSHSYTMDAFDKNDRNDVFDDEIVKYREARASAARPASEPTAVMRNRLFNAMLTRLMPGMSPSAPRNFFAGKLHEFMTCLSIAQSLRNNLLDDRSADYFEELALKCMLRSLATNTSEIWQAQLLIGELPSLIPLKSPSAGELKKACVETIAQVMNYFRLQTYWAQYCRYDSLLKMLKASIG